MAKVFRITQEQLDSLVEDAQDVNAASIIKEAILKTPNPHGLPRNPNHDGDGLVGLKRIYKWLNWEMVNWDEHRGTMAEVYAQVGKAVVEYDPTIILDDINKDTAW